LNISHSINYKNIYAYTYPSYMHVSDLIGFYIIMLWYISVYIGYGWVQLGYSNMTML